MARHPVYDQLLEEINDDLERKVFETLAERSGERVTREALVLRIFGRYVSRDALANDADDRKIRKAIEALQERGFPILANSGRPGYLLSSDSDELEVYITELESRRARLTEKIGHLRRARQLVWRDHPAPPVQGSFL